MSSKSTGEIYPTVEGTENGVSHGLVWDEKSATCARWKYTPGAAEPLKIEPVDALATAENKDRYESLRTTLLRCLASVGLQGGGGG
jgi:hypothetical protein